MAARKQQASSEEFESADSLITAEMRKWAKGLSIEECVVALEWIEDVDDWRHDDDLSVVHRVCSKKVGDFRFSSLKEKGVARSHFGGRFQDG